MHDRAVDPVILVLEEPLAAYLLELVTRDLEAGEERHGAAARVDVAALHMFLGDVLEDTRHLPVRTGHSPPELRRAS